MERLWSAVLALRDATPAVVLHLDCVTTEEYPRALKSETVRALLRGVTYESIARKVVEAEGTRIEDVRPFIGETLWSVFFYYRAFVGRVCLNIIGRIGAGGPWYVDSVTLRLLESSLSRNEVDELCKLRVGKFYRARCLIEEKILAGVRPVLSFRV